MAEGATTLVTELGLWRPFCAKAPTLTTHTLGMLSLHLG